MKEGMPIPEQELTNEGAGDTLSDDELRAIEEEVQKAREKHPDDEDGFKDDLGQISVSGKTNVGKALAASAVLLFAGGTVEKALSQDFQTPRDQQASRQEIDDETLAAQAAEDEKWTTSDKVTTINLEGGPNPDAGEYSGEATMEGAADMYRGVVLDTLGLQGQDLTDQQKAEVVNAAANLAFATLHPGEQGSFESNMGSIDAEDIAGAVEFDKGSQTIKVVNLEKIKQIAKALYDAAHSNIKKGMFAQTVYTHGPDTDEGYDFSKVGINEIDWSKY